MFEVSRVADTLVSQAALFNCTFEEAWRDYMHPAITENVQYDDVILYINEKIKLGQSNC